MKQKTVRLSIDIPVAQHIYLKMRAAQKGMTIREAVIEALALAEQGTSQPEGEDLDTFTFRSCFEKLRKEKWQLARNLSKL